MLWLLVPIILWMILIICVVPRKGFYKSQLDKLMHGRLRDDRNALQIMLNHLKNKPEEWSISRESAHFPKEGAKQIYLSYDRGAWNYQINSSGDRERILDGHFGREFSSAIAIEHDRRTAQSLMRNLYQFDGPLMLENKR